jgi:hypothetical protein
MNQQLTGLNNNVNYDPSIIDKDVFDELTKQNKQTITWIIKVIENWRKRLCFGLKIELTAGQNIIGVCLGIDYSAKSKKFTFQMENQCLSIDNDNIKLTTSQLTLPTAEIKKITRFLSPVNYRTDSQQLKKIIIVSKKRRRGITSRNKKSLPLAKRSAATLLSN